MSTFFADWQDGVITDYEAIRALCMELGEVESSMTPLEAEKQVLRDQISRVLEKYGGKAVVPGFGELIVTAPGRTQRYDRQKLDRLIIQLTADGYGPIAQQLAACRTEQARAGSLRISREEGGNTG